MIKDFDKQSQAEMALDVILDWSNPRKLYKKHGYNRIHTMRYIFRKFVRHFVETGKWELLDEGNSVAYNNQCVLEVIKNNWDYIQENINYDKAAPRTKPPANTCTQKLRKSKNVSVPVQPNLPRPAVIVALTKAHVNVIEELRELNKAYTSYNLSAEQVMHKIQQLI